MEASVKERAKELQDRTIDSKTPAWNDDEEWDFSLFLKDDAYWAAYEDEEPFTPLSVGASQIEQALTEGASPTAGCPAQEVESADNSPVKPCRLTFAATPTPSPTPAGIDVSDVLSDAGSAATPGGGPAPACTVTLTVNGVAMDPSTVTPVTSSIFTSAGNLVAPTNLAGSRTCAAPTPNPTFHLHVGPAKAESSAAGSRSSGMPEAEGAGESEAAPPSAAAPCSRPGAAARRRLKHHSSDPDSDKDDEDWEEEDNADWAKNTLADKLGVVDHSTIDYPPFRRSFYTETGALAKMTYEEVVAYRKELDDIKVRGRKIPKPVQNWFQCGLSSRVLELLQKLGFAKPMPIQAQALPAIMSVRDCIGIAKTGSGKTLAFVLPMLRHIKDQPPLAPGDGPVALIMAPTRELVVQIRKDIRRFSKAVYLSIVCAYGGSAVAEQISDLKRGAEGKDKIGNDAFARTANTAGFHDKSAHEKGKQVLKLPSPPLLKKLQNYQRDRHSSLYANFDGGLWVAAKHKISKDVEAAHVAKGTVGPADDPSKPATTPCKSTATLEGISKTEELEVSPDVMLPVRTSSILHSMDAIIVDAPNTLHVDRAVPPCAGHGTPSPPQGAPSIASDAVQDVKTPGRSTVKDINAGSKGASTEAAGTVIFHNGSAQKKEKKAEASKWDPLPGDTKLGTTKAERTGAT